MSFDDLPPQTPINANADAYAETCLRLSRAVAENSRAVLDVTYGPDYWQKLDIYLPEEPTSEPLPVLLFFHGGNFTHGYKEWCGFMAPVITAFPAIFVSVSYRLAPTVSYRDIMQDAFAALTHVRETIAELGGDPKRIFIGGHSAGAQIVVQMALQHEARRAAGLPDDAFLGVLPISGSYSRRLADIEADESLRVPADVPNSPIEIASKTSAPFFITWGGKEKEQVLRDGPALVAALKAVGQPVEHHVFPDDDHFSIHLNTGNADDLWTLKVREWMDRSR
ncbi:alpha/beta hydrolase [Oryzicola mucosus]|uniref:Alpha/beta hydrolase n=1 Tax=Oryzicola mucosus TaxID=2767425 RepID=A0A8J6PWQ6_9HYPH|nr:alpha/beta hydrolase [Oryzicola mucosus]MBD0415562.1 alpha/beta hydrolase [Oryzicola mucosus]